MKRLPFLLSLAAVLGVVFLFYRFSMLEQRPAKAAPAQHQVAEEHEEIEVAVFMGRIQHFHQKWWLAGKAGNAPLAKFYLHEMEEAMEEIADANITEDGVNVSEQMRTYGLTTVDHLSETLEKQGVEAMHAEAEMFANTCTSCHMATEHAYIRIKVPTEVSFPDQDFAPAK